MFVFLWADQVAFNFSNFQQFPQIKTHNGRQLKSRYITSLQIKNKRCDRKTVYMYDQFIGKLECDWDVGDTSLVSTLYKV